MKYNWKQVQALPADGKVRTVEGLEAVHHPRTAIRAASVVIHDGEHGIRRIQNPTTGKWGQAHPVNWNHGER